MNHNALLTGFMSALTSARPQCSAAGCAPLDRNCGGCWERLLAARPKRRGGGFTGDRLPLAHAPASDETVQDVRIFARERLGCARRFTGEQEHGAVDGIGERTTENELAARVRRPGFRKVLLAKRGTPLQVIRREVVEHQEVLHASFRSLRGDDSSRRILASNASNRGLPRRTAKSSSCSTHPGRQRRPSSVPFSSATSASSTSPS